MPFFQDFPGSVGTLQQQPSSQLSPHKWLGRRICDSVVVCSIPGRRTVSQLVPGWVTVLVGTSSRYVTSHPGQLGLLPSVGQEMTTGQSTVMLPLFGRHICTNVAVVIEVIVLYAR